MSKQPEFKIIDGRRMRSERSRAAIITATLNLIDNGNFVLRRGKSLKRPHWSSLFLPSL